MLVSKAAFTRVRQLVAEINSTKKYKMGISGEWEIDVEAFKYCDTLEGEIDRLLGRQVNS